jgi:hypothetical protein
MGIGKSMGDLCVRFEAKGGLCLQCCETRPVDVDDGCVRRRGMSRRAGDGNLMILKSEVESSQRIATML